MYDQNTITYLIEFDKYRLYNLNQNVLYTIQYIYIL